MPRFSIVFAVVFWSCFCVFSIAQPIQKSETMPVHKRINVAHRGASYLAPENTLLAYRICPTAGATGAECDVYATKDGVLILAHDATAKRTMGVANKKIIDMTYEEIRKCDAGSWKGSQFKGEKVPTLDEYLEVLQGTTCHPVIEIKMEGIESKVLDVVRKRNMVNVTTIIAFQESVVREIRCQEPSISVAFLYSKKLEGTPEEHADALAEYLIKACKELDTNILDLNYNILSATLIKTLQKAGIHVWTWTVNDPKLMKQLLDWGIESITTDRPEILTEVIALQ